MNKLDRPYALKRRVHVALLNGDEEVSIKLTRAELVFLLWHMLLNAKFRLAFMMLKNLIDNEI